MLYYLIYVLGLILMVLCFFAARYTAEKSDERTANLLIVLALCFNAAQQIGKLIGTMLGSELNISFAITEEDQDHSDLFVRSKRLTMTVASIVETGGSEEVPQGQTGMHSLTVLENVQLPCSMYGERPDEKRALALLERVGIARCLYDRITNARRIRRRKNWTLYSESPLSF